MPTSSREDFVNGLLSIFRFPMAGPHARNRRSGESHDSAGGAPQTIAESVGESLAIFAQFGLRVG